MFPKRVRVCVLKRLSAEPPGERRRLEQSWQMPLETLGGVVGGEL